MADGAGAQALIEGLQAHPGDRMFLRGIEVHARHGVYDHERRDGQRFIVDLDWWIETAPCAASDRLGDALCYAAVFDAARAILLGPSVALVETLAETIAQALLARFTAIRQVRVVVHKPEAPLPGVFADVGVEIMRDRRLAAPARRG